MISKEEAKKLIREQRVMEKLREEWGKPLRVLN
jgi:hypothetical protein